MNIPEFNRIIPKIEKITKWIENQRLGSKTAKMLLQTPFFNPKPLLIPKINLHDDFSHKPTYLSNNCSSQIQHLFNPGFHGPSVLIRGPENGSDMF